MQTEAGGWEETKLIKIVAKGTTEPEIQTKLKDEQEYQTEDGDENMNERNTWSNTARIWSGLKETKGIYTVGRVIIESVQLGT